MSGFSFATELERFGPYTRPPERLSPAESRRYCRRLASRHYENFTVASWFVPRRLRQHFYNIYAYCRWADDLADETGPKKGPGLICAKQGRLGKLNVVPFSALALLDWWEDQLRECYRGRVVHPVFVALAETIEQFEIPAEPFADLLVAFRRDQQTSGYETIDELLDYCRYSANPVGRLVLYLGRCHDPGRTELADSICTGLQLANFWQDVAGDWDRGRIYLPRADCRRFGYDQSMFARRESSEAFRRLLSAKVDEAEGWLRRGLPLVDLMAGPLRLQVALFIGGGLAILEAIRRQDHDVWSRRPKISRLGKLRLLADCWWRLRRGRNYNSRKKDLV